MEHNLELLLKNTRPNITRRPLVLAVDDDEDNLLLLSEVLRAIDCSFITATRGQTALLIAQSQQPDLILLDIMLPDFNGAEVLHRLRQDSRTRSIPVIAVTALARAQDRESLLLEGCEGYVSKPYMIDELEAIIHQHIA